MLIDQGEAGAQDYYDTCVAKTGYSEVTIQYDVEPR
jgi:hypothetical protein